MDATTPMTTRPRRLSLPHRWNLDLRSRDLVVKALTTVFLAAGAVLILIPLFYMISISLKESSAGAAGIARPDS
jgi:ABC-type glycerol-3-phosphate transport system permease component